jgi:uncharacterized zinc-type alcohol dehydrogenase-like protein
MAIRCYAALEANAPLREFEYEPSEIGPWDIKVSVDFCGLCHGDLHFIDNSWGISQYPMVPGHEIVGTVKSAGSSVTNVAIGQRVGIGLQVGACLECEWCLRGKETCCPNMRLIGLGQHGGFADVLHVDSRFAYPIPDNLDSEAAAPLLCAGATVFAPLRRHAGVSTRVGIIGIGGLGHLALQFARALGCEVTAFSSTKEKEEYAKALGAHRFVLVDDPGRLQDHAGTLDLILSTVDTEIDWMAYLGVLRPEGKFCLLGIPETVSVPALPLVLGRKSIITNLLANRSEMKEMLDLSSRFGIHATCESLPMAEVNTAIERVRRNDQRFRIVVHN